jgi:hypothetical protein
MYLWICGSFKTAKNNWVRKSANPQIANHKKIYGPQIANLQMATFAVGPQI